MNANGDDSHAPKVIRWLLPKSQAAKADQSMKLRIREKLCRAAYDELMLSEVGGWRLALIGHERRRKLCEAFVDTRPDGTKEDFRAKAQEYGVPLIVIVLVLSIAWDIFWHWWTNRKQEITE